MIRKLYLDQLIYSRNTEWRVLVLAMVVARILEGASRLFASRWWRGTTLPELLGLPTEGKVVNLLHEAMDNLLCRQGAIQRKLARRHLKEGCLVLWDLTSSYLEGRACPLAAFGKNRDGKKGKRQFTYGILTDSEAGPLRWKCSGGTCRIHSPSGRRSRGSRRTSGSAGRIGLSVVYNADGTI